MKNTLHQWILQNVLENQTIQRIAKFIMVDSYKMVFMKGNAILVKVDEKPASHTYLSRDEDGFG